MKTRRKSAGGREAGISFTVFRRFVGGGVEFNEGEELELIRENKADGWREVIFRAGDTGKFKTWTSQAGQYDCFDLVFRRSDAVDT